ncbi:MAG: septum formation initiator family protein [Candidatus Aegiribacteria sp.]|nr:septum formation initiator family protein [Candidatus Aegiribacteria sp.]
MRRRGNGNRRLFYVILVSVFVIVAAILVFNRHGFIALAGLKGDVDSISLLIDDLQTEIDSLESEIQRLRSDSLFLERMVREILGWGRPGEYIVRFTEPDSPGVPF